MDLEEVSTEEAKVQLRDLLASLSAEEAGLVVVSMTKAVAEGASDSEEGLPDMEDVVPAEQESLNMEDQGYGA